MGGLFVASSRTTERADVSELKLASGFDRTTNRTGVSMSLQGVTIQPIRRGTTNPDDVIRPEPLEHADVRDVEGTTDGNSWTARLYLWAGDPTPPSWLTFVRDGFGDDLTLPDSSRSSALIVMTIQYFSTRLFAIPLGAGRHALNRSACDFDAARRVQLNVVYEGDEGADALTAAPRVREAEWLRRGETSMRTRRQAGRDADFDQFEFDPEIEQLVGLTGVPVNAELFGTRVSGKTSLRLGRSIDFDDLAGICRTVAQYERKTDYKRRFSFVDRVTTITNASTTATLTAVVAAQLRDDPADWELSPPELVDFDCLSSLVVSHADIDEVEVDPGTAATDLLAALETAGVGGVTAELLQDITLTGITSDDGIMNSWRLIECLDGQFEADVEHEAATVLLTAGSFSIVQADYLAAIDAALTAIAESTVVLPNSHLGADGKEIGEGEYNTLAAASSEDFLLLDAKSVVIPGKTSPIEICDVLDTGQKRLVHVKRKFGSAALSHLFGQGSVSGSLLVDSTPFRSAVRAKLHDIDGASATHQALFDDDVYRAGDYEIVYGIIGDWQNGGLANRLPFFSKVNLLKHAQTLRRSGYKVTFAAIGVDN
ncbi:MAG: TIGR04141 family sporadically distributed protein [Acidimicrobiales bacterium]|nr:TIGR04141 family sporadically distributed protein [Acidimicrobiales bacterium]